MPRAFAEKEKQRIRERLLAEGQRQFAAYGLKKTRVEELAASAGISKGAFYLFYASKEALFMDVMEQAEAWFRQEVLAVIDRPGPSPQARLFAVLHKAFTLWKTTPLLRNAGDYELLARRAPAGKLQAHLRGDRAFVEELVARCQRAGIPIQAPAEQIHGLLYAAFFASLHEDDFGPGALAGTLDLLLALLAAFCLGAVKVKTADTIDRFASQHNGQSHELAD
jgi:AcrR family transcriptional regulator